MSSYEKIPIVENYMCNEESSPIGKITLKKGFEKQFVKHGLCLSFAYVKSTNEILYAYPVWTEHAKNKEIGK